MPLKFPSYIPNYPNKVSPNKEVSVKLVVWCGGEGGPGCRYFKENT